ncbi:uncharacterized protein LOC123316241 isoform X5 [Coccinella septempunctata]|uniref:uncharacterized protein LOC123316241 isoform X5 n=1 Tax=Coccinella septempunctata TaxID=41139 RepID=UPI001D08AF27|nr:uncharacterized protein LOC123316241 isoform X5 [Coccinella septempunctata]
MKVLYFLLIFLLAYAAATQALPSHQTSDGADMDGTVESVDEVRAKRGFDDRESSSLRDKRDDGIEQDALNWLTHYLKGSGLIRIICFIFIGYTRSLPAMIRNTLF